MRSDTPSVQDDPLLAGCRAHVRRERDHREQDGRLPLAHDDYLRGVLPRIRFDDDVG